MKMNRLIKLLPVMLFASLALSACIQEDLESPDGGLTEGNFTIQLTPPTKTANNGLSTEWVSGDKVNVFHAKAGTKEYVNDGAFEYVGGTGFKGTLSESLESGAYDWYVAYPYDQNMTTPKNMSINIPAMQTQAEDDSKAHLCGSLCPLIGKANGIQYAQEPALSMEHLVTIMKIKVTNYHEEPCNLHTVSFCHHTNDGQDNIANRKYLSGCYLVDFTGENPVYIRNDEQEPTIDINQWQENAITRSGNAGDDTRPYVILQTPKDLALNESATVYLACIPFDINTTESKNESNLSIGMNTTDTGVSQRINKYVQCKAGVINGVKQGSRQAPPFKSSVNFYYGQKHPDGSYEIIDEKWWRCDLPEGFDLNGEFDLKDLFTTLNVDASFTLIDAPNQNATVQYYYNDFQACLNGSKWNGTALNPDLNLSFPGSDKSGVFISVVAGHQVGHFNIFFRNPEPEADEPVVDTESDMYDSYQGLVMCGYQGWHGTPGDGCPHNPAEGWPHYASVAMNPFIFEPGVLRNNIDFWPDVTEYEKTYAADGFTYPDGSQAMVYSSYDESTVNLHFKWMKDYNIDGVFMQRFVSQIADPNAIPHSDKVLQSAMTASNVHARAISIMYDMVGMNQEIHGKTPGPEVIINDAAALKAKYNLDDRSKGQRYFLYHNGKPLIGLVSVGQASASYNIAQAQEVVDGLQELGFSIILGVPAYWRNPGKGDCVNDSKITDLIKDVDIIMPWFVGAYDYNGTVTTTPEGSFNDFWEARMEDKKILNYVREKGDYTQASEYGVEYCPLVFPGFSDKNMHPNNQVYNREGGDFYWLQIHKHLNKGANMLYVAMFDEIDEGTAIYKCLRQSEVPSNVSAKDYYVVYENGGYRRSDTQVSVSGSGNWCKKASELGVEFNGIEDNLVSDYYLWLTGQAAKVLKGEATLTQTKPTR